MTHGVACSSDNLGMLYIVIDVMIRNENKKNAKIRSFDVINPQPAAGAAVVQKEIAYIDRDVCVSLSYTEWVNFLQLGRDCQDEFIVCRQTMESDYLVGVSRYCQRNCDRTKNQANDCRT